MSEKSMGPVLRELGGCAVQIVTTRMDWETRMVTHGEQSVPALGQSLVAFAASRFRETKPESDIWEFVEEDSRVMVYLHGTDVFMVRVPSALT